MQVKSKLALLGGPKSVESDPGDIFNWPIVTPEHEEAVLEVLRRGGMSGTDVTRQFESEYADWIGTTYALGANTGTEALRAAMYGAGVGVGDEMISPSVTYWASCLQALSLGASVVFADIDPDTLCIDPNDIEHRITERTKAIVAVHYCGHPADLDPIMEIARKHGVKVIEDVSHAHGGLYKGRTVGTIGDVAGMSLMSGKSFATGEAGIMTTNDREIYDRALGFGHYDMYSEENIETEYLKPYAGLPLGGYKYRVNQLSSAMGRVTLKYYDGYIAEIQQAMNYFWDLLEGVPGIAPHRPAKDSDSTMGGWYAARGLYRPEEVGGLSISRFAQAVSAEGARCGPGTNKPLHPHPLFHEADVYGHGKPTNLANASCDVRQPLGSLPVSEGISARTYSIPWFKKFRPHIIEEYAAAYRKAAESYEELLEDDPGTPEDIGTWRFYSPA
ncbi:MAG: DegT/DnrJ/EryC1/StrS family aminotransferase [Chloroflexi bacterium]|nr:DegT/DnrJ/EryC1/StrS family aminotransferase [Chloroflexota bacterium]